MYAVKVGEEQVRVMSKDDAMILVNILFRLDCDERISSKPVAINEHKKEEKCEEKSKED